MQTITRLSRLGSFRQQVLTAYGHRCAVTGVQLRLVDAAHVLPVGAPGSADDVRNGIALSPTYHRAFDADLIYLAESYEMLINPARERLLAAAALDGGVVAFREPLGKRIMLPPDPRQRPDASFIRRGNRFRQVGVGQRVDDGRRGEDGMKLNIDPIRKLLVQHGMALLAEPFTKIPFTEVPEADKLLNDLDHHPHIFVLGCLMDRQAKAEKCWLAPYEFGRRIGSFEMGVLAGLSERKVRSVFGQRPALHWMVKKMAPILHAGIQKIACDYRGDASRIWSGKPSSAALVRRFLEFDGVGSKIATMAANILVRQFKIEVSDTYSIDISADVHVRRTFERLGLVRTDASPEEVIYAAREMNPEYPGVLDASAWDIGHDWCRPHEPKCEDCYMREVCPTAQKSG
ncbi:MAG: HNH endonuclease [Myxococcota bacterium]|nr:HNH endonuclease [Myxococcota bacterium]